MELTIHDHPHDSPLLQLLPKLRVVHLGLHVPRQDGEVGPQVLFHVVRPVSSVCRRVDYAPDVQGWVTQCQTLVIQNLDSLWSAWKKGF